MSDENKKIVLQIELSADQAASKLIELKQKTQDVKKEQALYNEELQKLADKGGEGTVAYDNLQKKIIGVNAELKSLNTEQKIYQRIIDGNATANSAQEGSLVQLRAQLSALTAQYSLLSEEEKKAAEGTELQDSVRAISDELKKQEGTLGDNRRNVGNYNEAIAAVVKSIDSQRSTLSSLNSQMKVLNDNGLNNTKEFQALQNQIEKTNKSISSGTLVLVDQLNKQYEQLVNTQGAASKEALELNNQISELTGELKNNTTVIQSSAESYVSMKKQMQDAILVAEELGQKFGTSSAEATAAREKIAELKEQIKDFKQNVDLLTPEGKFEAFAKIGGGIASAFEAAQGALHLFGLEGDAAEKALVKIQAAMAFADGLRGVATAAKDFKEFRAVLGTVGATQTATATTATALAGAEGVASSGAVAMGASFSAMLGPIGLAIVAITAVIALLDDSAKQKANIESITAAVEVENAAHNKTIDALKLRNQSEIDSAEAALNAANARGEGIDKIAELEKNLATAKSNALSQEKIETTQHLQELEELNTRSLAQLASTTDEELVKDLQKKIENGNKEIEATKNRNAEILNEQKKLGFDIEQLEIEQENKRRALRDESINLRIGLIKDGEEREIQAVQQSTQQKLDQIKGGSEEETNLKISILEDQTAKINQIKSKYRQKEIEDRATVSLLSAEPGTEQRIQLEIENAKKIRDAKLLNESLTASERKVIIATANKQVEDLENSHAEIIRKKQSDLVEQKNRAALAAANIDLINAGGNDVDKYLAKLNLINESYRQEVDAKQSAANELIRITQKQQNDELEALRVTDAYRKSSPRDQADLEKNIVDEKAAYIVQVEQTAATEIAQINASKAAEIVATQNEFDAAAAQRRFTENDNIIQGTIENSRIVLDLQLQNLDIQRDAEIRNAEETGQSTAGIFEKYEKIKTNIKRQQEEAQIALASSTLKKGAELFSKHTAAYKVLASSAVILDTYMSASAAYRSMMETVPPPYNFPAAIAAAAIATAAGLKNLAAVNSVKIDNNPGFEQGGYTGKGHPKSVSKALGEKPYTYHADEYVVPSPVLNSPEGGMLVNHLERMRLYMHNLGPGPRMVMGRLHAESGGLIPILGNPLDGRAIVNVTGISAEEVRSIVTDTVRSMPGPVVSVQEINTVQQGVQVREGLSNW